MNTRLNPFIDPTPSTWPHNALEHAIQLATSDPNARADFWKRLLEATLVIPAQQTTIDNAPAGIIAFTSPEILALSLTPVPDRALITTTELFNRARTTGAEQSIFLNPVGPYGKEFKPQEIAYALNGIIQTEENRVQITKPTQVLVATLAHEPTDLLNQLTADFAKSPHFRAAYITGIAYPGTNDTLTPHPLIAIDAGHHYGEALSLANTTLTNWAHAHGLIDVVDAQHDTNLAPLAKSSGRRFYTNHQSHSSLQSALDSIKRIFSK